MQQQNTNYSKRLTKLVNETVLAWYKIEEKEIEPKSNRRVIGVGSQILRALNLKQITVLGTPTKYNAVSGFDIEITGFINE